MDLSFLGIGFGMGMERLPLIAELGAQIPQPRNVEVYAVRWGEEARKVALHLPQSPRAAA